MNLFFRVLTQREVLEQTYQRHISFAHPWLRSAVTGSSSRAPLFKFCRLSKDNFHRIFFNVFKILRWCRVPKMNSSHHVRNVNTTRKLVYGSLHPPWKPVETFDKLLLPIFQIGNNISNTLFDLVNFHNNFFFAEHVHTTILRRLTNWHCCYAKISCNFILWRSSLLRLRMSSRSQSGYFWVPPNILQWSIEGPNALP